MVFPISRRAKKLLDNSNIKLQIILEIDGFENTAIFGAVDVEKFARIGEDGLTIGSFYIGGTIKDSRSRDYISTSGTTTKISQQVLPDKAGTTSVQKLRINLVDKEQYLTKIFSPGEIVPDLLGRDATVYVGFQGGAHPEDSIPILYGVIDENEFGAGFVKLTVAHPESFKRQQLFNVGDTELASGIGPSDTTIYLINGTAFLEPSDILETYLLIEDEKIRYTSKTGNTFNGCIRGAEGTTAVSHSVTDEVKSFYIVEENAVELSLKLMLSGGDEFFAENVLLKNFVNVDVLNTIDNAVGFTFDVKTKFNLQIGDFITITGAANGANNVTSAIIQSFGFTGQTYYIILAGVSLVSELATPGVAKFKSQFNTIPEGCGMRPIHIDIERHLFWIDLFGPIYPRYRFEIPDAIDAKEFIDGQIYFPAALYSVPRKGRVSLQMNIQPLAFDQIIRLNDSTVQNPKEISIERSTTQFFYNTVEYAHNYDSLKQKFFRRDVRVSQDSLDRIKIGIKKLLIEAQGLRKSIDAETVITSLSRRFIDRYRFGAERIIGINVLYKVGMQLEIGDAVVMEGKNLKISDMKRGDRRFAPRLMEVINKEWDYAKAMVKLDLLDTSFEINARYGIIGPSSFLGSGSTTNEIKIVKSFGTTDLELEQDKWLNYIGEVIAIRSDDYSFYTEVVLIALSDTKENVLVINPPLVSAPPAGYVVDMPQYSGDSLEKGIWKSIHCFVSPVVTITGGISQTVFSVGAGDIAKFFIGGRVKVFDETYLKNSETLNISDITGLNITVDKPLGFVPVAGDLTSPIGFPSDEGLPYNYL